MPLGGSWGPAKHTIGLTLAISGAVGEPIVHVHRMYIEAPTGYRGAVRKTLIMYVCTNQLHYYVIVILAATGSHHAKSIDSVFPSS